MGGINKVQKGVMEFNVSGSFKIILTYFEGLYIILLDKQILGNWLKKYIRGF